MKAVVSQSYTLLFIIGSVGGQEKPLFHTPKFNFTVSHRTNLCDRQRMLYNDTIQLKDALRDLDLNVVFLDEPFMFDRNEAGEIFRPPKYPGMLVVLLDELSKRAGFRWRNTYAAIKPLTKEDGKNRTWLDLLEWSTDTYDLSIERFSKTSERMKRGVAFPEGWFDKSIILVGRGNRPAVNIQRTIFGFLEPFEWGVWLLIFLAIMVTGVVYWLLKRMDKNADARELDQHPGATLFLSALVFVQQFEFKPDSNPAKMVAFSWAFWAVIMGSAYTANLASFLVSRQLTYNGVQNLAQAEKLATPVCVERGSSRDDFVTREYPRANLKKKETEEATFRALWTGECDVTVAAYQTFLNYERMSEINSDCSLQWVGKTMKIVSGGFATAVDTGIMCTSLVSFVIDLYMLELKADGFLEAAFEEYYDRSTDQSCAKKTAEDKSDTDSADDYLRLNVQDVGGIFLFHAFFCTVSLLAAGFEHYRQGRKEKKSTFIDSQEEHSDDVITDFGIPAQYSTKQAESNHPTLWNSSVRQTRRSTKQKRRDKYLRQSMWRLESDLMRSQMTQQRLAQAPPSCVIEEVVEEELQKEEDDAEASHAQSSKRALFHNVEKCVVQELPTIKQQKDTVLDQGQKNRSRSFFQNEDV